MDKYRYDEAWEREPSAAIPDFYHELPISLAPEQDSARNQLGLDGVILDFRQPHDFAFAHLPGAVSIPLSTLTNSTPSPFTDSQVLAEQWTELENLFSQSICGASDEVANVRKGKHVLTICYDGDTSRVANSVLRAKGVQSESCKGGFRAARQWLEGSRKEPDSPPPEPVKTDVLAHPQERRDSATV